MCLNRNSNIPSQEKFTFFWKGEFSQFYPAKIVVDNITYSTNEQYMMAGKAILFNDRDTLLKIMNTSNPREQKALGREVKNFDKDKWEAEAKNIVYKGNYAKFTQHPTLQKMLLATAGTTLVEASPKDAIWGIALSEDDPRAQDRATWQGRNWLGEVLTEVRNDIMMEDIVSGGVPDDKPSDTNEVDQKLIEELEQKVKDLCSEADLAQVKYMDAISNFTFKTGVQLTNSTSKYLKLISKLTAISLINDYENIELKASRGVSVVGGRFGPAREIKPSGKECAKILLYSGMDKYHEDIPTDYV